MMTAALSLPARREWTVDDLAGLPSDRRFELINGRLVVTSPIGPHQDLSVRVLLAIEANCPPGFAPFVELSLLVDRRNQPRPDVAAVRLDHIDRSPVPVQDAALVVEVLSAENTLKEVQEKQQLYASAGVPCYWVINPRRGPITLTELTLDPATGKYRDPVLATDRFETDRPWPVTLDLSALTKRWEALHGQAG